MTMNNSVTTEVSCSVARSSGYDRREKGVVITSFDLLHRRLEVERESLMNRIMNAIHPLDNGPTGSYPMSENELASDRLEVWKQEILRKREYEQLVRVERALHKFEEGTYGLCDLCGQPIGAERLEALPEADLCYRCKIRLKNREAPKSTRIKQALS
jgi:RNA polymerase-binding transcription factor DksA